MIINYHQNLELSIMHKFVYLISLRLSTYIFLPLLLLLAPKIFANNLNNKVFKTPTEASVSFQVIQGGFHHIICAGARISHYELITSMSCLKKLQAYQYQSGQIHALSSHGKDYGGIHLTQEESTEGATSASGNKKLTRVLLKSPGRLNNHWPNIHGANFIQNELVGTQSYSAYAPDKQLTVNKWLFNECRNEQCILNNNDSIRLNDGEAVFHNKKLVCVNTDWGCIEAKSLEPVRLNDGSCSSDLRCLKCSNMTWDTCILGSGSGNCTSNNHLCSFYNDMGNEVNPDADYGYYETVNCPDCYAESGLDNVCVSESPYSCMARKSGCSICLSDKLLLAGEVIGGTIGGIAIIAVVTVVVAGMIYNYKRRHRTGYTQLET